LDLPAHRFHAGDAASGGLTRVFGGNTRAPAAQSAHRAVFQRLAGGARQPLRVSRPHRLGREPRGSRSRCSTTRSSAPTTRACTTASGSSPTRSRSCRSTRRSPPRSPAPSRRSRAFNGRLTGSPRAPLAAGEITEPCRPLSDQRARSARDQQPDRRPRGRAPALQREHVQRSLIPGDLQHRGGAHHRARAHAYISAPDRRGSTRAIRQLGRRGFSRRSRCAGRPARYSAGGSTGCGAGWMSSRPEEPLPAPRVARAGSTPLRLHGSASCFPRRVAGPLAPAAASGWVADHAPTTAVKAAAPDRGSSRLTARAARRRFAGSQAVMLDQLVAGDQGASLGAQAKGPAACSSMAQPAMLEADPESCARSSTT